MCTHSYSGSEMYNIIIDGAAYWQKSAPLHLASEEGHNDVVVLLLSRPGVDINVQDLSGHTALSIASRWGHEGTVKPLLAHPKVEVNVEDENGEILLSLASRHGKEGVVRYSSPIPCSMGPGSWKQQRAGSEIL